MRLDKLFDIKSGLASSQVEVHSSNSNSFVAYIRPSSTQGRTLAGWIDPSTVQSNVIYPKETLFVSTDGEGSHTYAYVSDFDFIANSNVSILIPKKDMTLQEKIFYARCITMNRYKFSYGRKPKGGRLGSIELPNSIPDWLSSGDTFSASTSVLDALDALSTPILLNRQKNNSLNTTCSLKDIFHIFSGNKLDLNKMTLDNSGIPFISRTSKNNGISARVGCVDGVLPFESGQLTVALGGSVLSTHVQLHPFYTGQNVAVLKPKIEMSMEEMLFYCHAIYKNAYKFNACGREANRFLKDLLVPIRDSIPSWVYGSIVDTTKGLKPVGNAMSSNVIAKT